ncbi:hypothetical protein XELAEV_18003147mg [Xenopus laevis]|nr:hypothetical protein XELAEV_18003147mg [Xenopus laevis]
MSQCCGPQNEWFLLGLGASTAQRTGLAQETPPDTKVRFFQAPRDCSSSRSGTSATLGASLGADKCVNSALLCGHGILCTTLSM